MTDKEALYKTVAIVGSRQYPQLWALDDYIRGWLPNACEAVISGGADGVDQYAARVAREVGYPVKEFLADWSRYGRRAGMLRNAEIVKAADLIVAFWDEESPGTKGTIELARKAKKPLVVYGKSGRVIARERYWDGHTV